MQSLSLQDWLLLMMIVLFISTVAVSMDWMSPNLQPVYAEGLWVETMGTLG